MHFEDSRRWRPHTTSYELPRMRQLAIVSKAIPFHPRNGVLGRDVITLEPASPRCCAPIDPTADVPAGQRLVRAYLPGRAFVCLCLQID
jgi:hypothetical protein